MKRYTFDESPFTSSSKFDGSQGSVPINKKYDEVEADETQTLKYSSDDKRSSSADVVATDAGKPSPTH